MDSLKDILEQPLNVVKATVEDFTLHVVMLVGDKERSITIRCADKSGISAYVGLRKLESLIAGKTIKLSEARTEKLDRFLIEDDESKEKMVGSIQAI